MSRSQKNTCCCSSKDTPSGDTRRETPEPGSSPAAGSSSGGSSLEEKQRILDQVRQGYGEIARTRGASCCGPATSCGCGPEDAAYKVAATVGYSQEDLEALPEGANMGLSCGNPVALASLKEGDVVVDLGSGGGFDVFIAGRKVGPNGRVIGVDMTPDMIARARGNVASYKESTGLNNVEFRLGEIEALPLPDQSADVVISNCVINLSGDKPRVWGEMARVLKPGGRVAVSDIALLQPLPEEIMRMVASYVGCIAGAVPVQETEKMAREAGLVDIVVEKKAGYVDAFADWKDPLYLQIMAALPEGATPGQYIASVNVSARRP